ncbi:MAG: hypothetical protein ACKVJX_20910 [Verrucomicrobiia bacterium]
MMLLDTCALLWLATGGGKLRGETVRAIKSSPVLAFSAITSFEIVQKAFQGKFENYGVEVLS